MEHRYAGFWMRVLALIIDGVIIGAISYLLGALSGVEDYVFSSILGLLYYIIMPVTNLQATLGKSVLGLKIIDLEGEKISVGQSIGRYFSQILSAIILLIGYMMVGWTKRKQGLHDKLASTYVIYK
ncbi:RDD family protein [Sutcliffiella deserti]|uniref:RDD family protein n=1 Tax=Sutcliffiella deserti TaxID=2875501 RepID=UPI001CC139C0|nr:RDD family protein [Sutcliffiella deserti]